MAVPRSTHSFTLFGLSSNQDYDVTISALCVYAGLRTESEKVTTTLTTLPERVRNLQLDHSTPSSITVKWDSALAAQNIRFKICVQLDSFHRKSMKLFCHDIFPCCPFCCPYKYSTCKFLKYTFIASYLLHLSNVKSDRIKFLFKMII
jgi:hypothetical protein